VRGTCIDAAQHCNIRGALETNSSSACPCPDTQGTGLVRLFPKSLQLALDEDRTAGVAFHAGALGSTFVVQFDYGTVMEMVPSFVVAPPDWACTVS